MFSVREIECKLQVSVSQQKEKENALAQYWATSFSLQSELVSVRISYSPKFNIFLKNKNVDSQTGVELDAEQCPTMQRMVFGKNGLTLGWYLAKMAKRQKWSHFRMVFGKNGKSGLIFRWYLAKMVSL